MDGSSQGAGQGQGARCRKRKAARSSPSASAAGSSATTSGTSGNSKRRREAGGGAARRSECNTPMLNWFSRIMPRTPHGVPLLISNLSTASDRVSPGLSVPAMGSNNGSRLLWWYGGDMGSRESGRGEANSMSPSLVNPVCEKALPLQVWTSSCVVLGFRHGGLRYSGPLVCSVMSMLYMG